MYGTATFLHLCSQICAEISNKMIVLVVFTMKFTMEWNNIVSAEIHVMKVIVWYKVCFISLAVLVLT